MLSSIISDLEITCRLGVVKLEKELPWLSAFKKSPGYSRGLARLSEVRHAVETTAALFEDQKIVPIESDKSGWSALVLSLQKEAMSLSTVPGNAVVHIIEASNPLYLRICPLEGMSSFHDIPAHTRLGSPQTVALSAGETFVVPQGMVAIQLEGTSCGVQLLRFNGPVVEPLSLAFETDGGAMLATSFSDTPATGKHFFATLVLELARSKACPHGIFEAGEVDAIADLMESLLTTDVHAFTRWKLMQTLARLRPAVAVKALGIMARRCELPNLQRQAFAALEKQRMREV